MAYPMVPKITIAVRSYAAQRPSTRFPAVQCGRWRRAVSGSRRVSVSARSLFPGMPFRHGRGSLPCPPRDVVPRQERFCHAGLLPGLAAEASRSARQPLRRCSGRQADSSATAQVHRSGASPGRAMNAAWTGSITQGIPFPATALSSPRLDALYARHRSVTTDFCLDFCLAALDPAALQAHPRPVTTGFPRRAVTGRDASDTSCDRSGSDGAAPCKAVPARDRPPRRPARPFRGSGSRCRARVRSWPSRGSPPAARAGRPQ